MSLLRLAAATDYARAPVDQSNIALATTLGFKLRIPGAVIAPYATMSPASGMLVEVSSGGSTLRVQGVVQLGNFGGGLTLIVIQFNHSSFPNARTTFAYELSDFDEEDDYVLVATTGAAGWTMTVREVSTGAALTPSGALGDPVQQAPGTQNVPNPTAGLGRVYLGFGPYHTPQVNALPGFLLDGLAIYDAAPPNNVTEPSTADTGLLWYVPFADDGANVVAGATAINTFSAGASIIAGGGWNGPAVGPDPAEAGLPFIESVATAYPLAFVGAPATAGLPFIESTATTYGIGFVLQAALVALPFLVSAAQVYPLQVDLAPATVALPFLDTGAVVYPVGVTLVPATFALPLLDSGSTAYPVAFVAGAAALALPFLESVAATYPVVIEAGVPQGVAALPFLESVAIAYPVALVPGAVTYALPLVDSTAQTYPIALQAAAAVVALAFIDTASTAFPVRIMPGQVVVALPLIDTMAQVYGLLLQDAAIVRYAVYVPLYATEDARVPLGADQLVTTSALFAAEEATVTLEA